MKNEGQRRGRRRIFGIAILFVGGLNLLAGFIIYLTNSKKIDSSREEYQDINHFLEALEIVKNNYVDPKKSTHSQLLNNALNGMVTELDPFCHYDDVKAYALHNQLICNETCGIGIEMGFRDGFPEVISVIEKGPSSKVGILPGDRISQVNRQSVSDLSFSDCRQMILGEKGSSVQLTIVRPPKNQIFHFNVIREPVDTAAITGPIMMTGGIAFVRIAQFQLKSGSAFRKVLAKVEQQGARGLILDLRGNPGGELTEAVAVCDALLPPNQLVVRLEGRNLIGQTEFSTGPTRKNLNLPMVILVDAYTASGAEIVAGTLRDYNRAQIVGERTYGKGVAQTAFPLSNGSAFWLTTAHYYTKGGYNINGRGVTPHHFINLDAQKQSQIVRQRIRYPGQIKPNLPNAIEDTVLKKGWELLYYK